MLAVSCLLIIIIAMQTVILRAYPHLNGLLNQDGSGRMISDPIAVLYNKMEMKGVLSISKTVAHRNTTQERSNSMPR